MVILTPCCQSHWINPRTLLYDSTFIMYNYKAYEMLLNVVSLGTLEFKHTSVHNL